MKTIISLFLMIFLAFFSVSSLAAATEKNKNVSNQPLNQTAPQKDAEIFKVLMVIDQNEVTAASEALKRTTNNDVKNFAQLMNSDHSQNLHDAQTLSQTLKITPKDSGKSLSIEKKGKALMEKLTALQGKDFDKTYVDAMVKGHQEALNILNVYLIPKTTSSELSKFLQTTREVVSHHLAMAKELQKKIQ